MSKNITAAEVNKLRKMTGAGIMDCKKALVASEGIIEDAIDYLRKKGAKVAENRKNREANEGVVIAGVSSDKTSGYLIELACETDFVAKNTAFQAFARKIENVILAVQPNSLERLLEEKIDDIKIRDAILDMTGKVGEKIILSKYEQLKGTFIVSYTHSNNKLGVLVSLSESDKNLISVGKDIAMQIAAMNPISVDKNSVDSDRLEREAKIVKEQTDTEGKPEAIVEKIIQGRLNKFFKEFTLLSQDYIKDTSKTVAGFLNEAKQGLSVENFIRIQLGS